MTVTDLELQTLLAPDTRNVIQRRQSYKEVLLEPLEEMQAIRAADLSNFNDELFCPEFSGFDSDRESPVVGAAASATSSPSPLVFIADRDLLQSHDPVEFASSEETWKNLEKCAAQIGIASDETTARMAAFGSTRLNRVPKLVQQINMTAHGFAMPLHWSHVEKTTKLASALGQYSSSRPMLSFFKKALKVASVVAARVFVGFDRIIVPAILDDTVATHAVCPQIGSLVEGLSSERMGDFITSPKPLCEAGLLAPSEGLTAMTSPIHAVGLRIQHSDILVPYEKISDATVMTQSFKAIAFAVAGCILELQSDNFLSRTGIFLHEFMTQLQSPECVPAVVAQAPVAVAPVAPAPIDIQSIVNEAVRQATATTTLSGPMRRRQKNAPKPSAMKLGFNLRGARTKFQTDEREGRIMYLRILRKNILCRRFAQPQNSSHGGARSGPEQEEIRRKGFEQEFEEAKTFGLVIGQFVNFVATVDSQSVPVAQKHMIKQSSPLQGFSDGVDAIQMDDASATLTVPMAIDEELDGAAEHWDVSGDGGSGQGDGSGDYGADGSGYAMPTQAASPTTIEAATSLAALDPVREEQEMTDFTMRALGGSMDFSEEELIRIRNQASRSGPTQIYMQQIVNQQASSDV